MENVITIRLALEQIGAGYQFGGSVTDGTQEAWNAVEWEDERPKPSWDELRAAHARAVQAELFATLRASRDTRLAATDKYMLADYPINEDNLALVKAYRAALRDLPGQPGAPWDGGGDATPWPIMPEV
jgi:hypothetical protein